MLPVGYRREEHGIKITINDRVFYIAIDPTDEFSNIHLIDGETGCLVGTMGHLIINWDRIISNLEKMPNVMTYPEKNPPFRGIVKKCEQFMKFKHKK